MKTLSFALITALALVAAPRAEAACRGAQLCRSGGQLINQRGTWISPCGPNGERGGLDPICHDITQCSAAGGFGKFVAAVTANCRGKTFDGYYGLDGITYGLLDWTADNMPTLFELYKTRAPAKFNSIFGSLHLPMQGNCLDPQWVCNHTKTGFLNCDAGFRAAFQRSLLDPDLQKAQLQYAINQFQQRIHRFQGLGLRTSYGLVSMAVVANNLRGVPACQPATWKRQCQGQGDEPAVVRCMLQKYADNSCRHTHEGSVGRMNQINAVFRGHESEVFHAPDVSAIAGCSSHWGSPSAGGRSSHGSSHASGSHGSKKASKKASKRH